LSDDDKNLICDNEYNIHARDVILKAGAGFIVVLAGKIMTIPGLPKVPTAESIDIDREGNVIGIF
jgi:formate--tetrahydrofolate ligase